MMQVAFALGLLLTPALAPGQTIEDVVARYLKARGGLERLHAVQSVRATGRLTLGDVTAPFVLELKRPAKMRTEFTVEGHTGVRAFDGKTAWAILPLPGESAHPMRPDEADEARAQADVDLSPLVDSERKGYTVSLAGREELTAGEAWKVLVRDRDGRSRTLFLDARTYLVVRAEETRPLEGKDVLFVSEIGDYRAVDGLVFPHRIVTGPKGQPDDWQRVEFDKIEVNPVLDDSRFAMPKTTPGR
jgi:outer membrane lipoprotein-sorting protein